MNSSVQHDSPEQGLRGAVDDWSSDQDAFKKVPWGKA